MNQKNIFTLIAVILTLQTVGFYTMGDRITSHVYPTLETDGILVSSNLLQVISMVLIIIALISLAVRTSPQVLWAYAIGFSLFSLNTLKHIF